MASSKKKAGSGEPSAPSSGRARGVKKVSAARKPATAEASTRTAAKKKTPAKKKASAPARTKAAPKKAAATRPAPKPKPKAPAPKARAAARRPALSRPRRRAELVVEPVPGAVPGLSEEDQIRAAKYLPRELPKRLFEEDRFLFPETYGVNRVRLLVRDPEWIFAYWDVSPAAMKDLGRSLGERGLALSRLTLRVLDPVSGGSSDILLPPGARWWYIRTDSARRSYRAELGVTLPSGEFRRLAESNTVVTPRVGPSAERARRRMSYRDARELPPSAAEAAGEAEKRAGTTREPLSGASVDGAAAPGEAGRHLGGASDVFRPGGASDTFRR
jgi:hypothetical protein